MLNATEPERPTWPDENETSPQPDFWAVRDGSAVWLAISSDAQCDPNAVPLPPTFPAVEWIRADSLDQHRVWIQNWLSLLPYLGITGMPNFDSLVTRVVTDVDSDSCFNDLEQQFSATDPLLVRTAVITALHQGLLVSEDLQHKQWDRFTRITKLPTRNSHATR